MAATAAENNDDVDMNIAEGGENDDEMDVEAEDEEDKELTQQLRRVKIEDGEIYSLESM